MSKEDHYYNLLSRLDHPAFKNVSDSGLSPDDNFNQVLNRILAKEMAILKTVIGLLYLGQFPHLASQEDMPDWEFEYFNLIKPSKGVDARRSELLQWINNPLSMSLPDVINLAESIVGKTPSVILNADESGFLLDEVILEETSSLDGESTPENKQTYIVSFTETIPNDIAKILDERLTQIEKAGSKHYLVFPELAWVIDESVLGEDTYLR